MSQKVKVIFEKLYVTHHGDSSRETYGELYYSFCVDDKKVASVSSSSPIKAKENKYITVNKSITVSKNSKDKLKIHGYLGDKDQGFNGKDERDDIRIYYSASKNWGDGKRSVHFVDGNLNVTLYYCIEVEGQTEDAPSTRTPRKSASLAIVSFEDSKFYNLVQDAHNLYGHCFEGYSKSILLKKTYKSPKKPSVHIKTPTKAEFLECLIDLANDGYYIDVFIFSHGTTNKVTLEDRQTITSSDIRGLSTGRYAGGRFPIRMVYQMNCVGSSLNDDFIRAGAKAVVGANDINFYPNQFNKFVKTWNNGERFSRAILNSNTASSRTVMQTLIVADSKTTRFSPKCKPFTTVLGKNPGAKAYFTSSWGLDYVTAKSGKDNMNASSKMIIHGDAGLRKSDRESW